jgi:DNA processing protein
MVISGLALGIDSAAHEGALAGAGTTVAILGTGADRPYPRSRRNLYERIRAGGVVASELPPGSPTFRWMFPARNRLMAALAGITVVVEAAERSGSLITADMAAEIGRQVGAVPGPVTSWRSSGTNKLLADGAAVVRGAQDVLDALLGPGMASIREFGPAVDGRGRAVLMAVEAGAGSADAVSAGAGVPYGEALAALGRLEREGYLSSDATGRYTRTAQAVPVRSEGRQAPSTIS